MKKSPVAKQINYNGLTNPITPAELKAFSESASRGMLGFYRIAMRIFGGIFVSIGFISLVIGAIAGNAIGSSIVGGLVFITMGGAIIFGAGFLERAYLRALRLSRFAHDNGWFYSRLVQAPSHPGTIFQQGHSRSASDMIYLTGDASVASFEIGNYQYTTGSGKNQQTHHWVYACIEMDRNLPNMILDARSNNLSFFGKNLSSNLPISLSKDQVLSLEGDFNNYFTLYAPKDYERDALYIFTPDLMALLIDNARSFDAEVIDNKFYIYAQHVGGTQTTLTNPHFMYKLLTIIHSVGMKVHRQSDYYADETIPDRAANVVAHKGRRLKQRVSWAVIIIVGVIIVFNVLPFFIRFSAN